MNKLQISVVTFVERGFVKKGGSHEIRCQQMNVSAFNKDQHAITLTV